MNCASALQVYLTDRSDAVDIERNVCANIELNCIGHIAQFMALDWGRVSAVTDSQLAIFATVDVLLAADCFYDSQGTTVVTLYAHDRLMDALTN